jgi:hypothetical protein
LPHSSLQEAAPWSSCPICFEPYPYFPLSPVPTSTEFIVTYPCQLLVIIKPCIHPRVIIIVTTLISLSLVNKVLCVTTLLIPLTRYRLQQRHCQGIYNIAQVISKQGVEFIFNQQSPTSTPLGWKGRERDIASCHLNHRSYYWRE